MGEVVGLGLRGEDMAFVLERKKESVRYRLNIPVCKSSVSRYRDSPVYCLYEVDYSAALLLDYIR